MTTFAFSSTRYSFSHWDWCKAFAVLKLREQFLSTEAYSLTFALVLSQVLPFPSQVVYNRVGKCGSRTVVLLLRILSERHGFNLVTSDIHNKTRLTKNEQVSCLCSHLNYVCLPFNCVLSVLPARILCPMYQSCHFAFYLCQCGRKLNEVSWRKFLTQEDALRGTFHLSFLKTNAEQCICVIVCL